MTLVTVHRFRRTLASACPDPAWPPGFALIPFDAERHREVTHGLLREGYANGGGWVAEFEEWWQSLSTDAEYDPALIFVAADTWGDPVGVAICWTIAFVKDLVVARRARRRGIASALLNHAFSVFQARGAEFVELKADADNAAAVSLYRRLSMEIVETLDVEADA